MPYSKIPPSSLLRLVLPEEPISPRTMVTLLRQGSITVADLNTPISTNSLVSMRSGPASGVLGHAGADETAIYDPMDDWDKERWNPLRNIDIQEGYAKHVDSLYSQENYRLFPLWVLWLINLKGPARARGSTVLISALKRYRQEHPETTLDVLAPLDVVTPTMPPESENRLMVFRVIDLLAFCLHPKKLAEVLDSLPPDRVRDLSQRRPPDNDWPMLSLNWIWDPNRCYHARSHAPVEYSDLPVFEEQYQQVLMARGWSLDLPDFTGRQPILYSQSLNQAKKIFDLGADPRVCTPDGQSLLDIASQWMGKASVRVAAITEIQSWMAIANSKSVPSDNSTQSSVRSGVQAAEVLVRTAPLTALRPIFRKIGQPDPKEDPTIFVKGLLHRIFFSGYIDRSTNVLLNWALSKNTKSGWWNFEAPFTEIPGWNFMHVLGVILSAERAEAHVCLAPANWSLPLSSVKPINAFVKWSETSFFEAFHILKRYPETRSEGYRFGCAAEQSLTISFRYAGPKRPLDLALAEDACVEDIAPARPGRRAVLGLMNNNLLSRIGGHIRILAFAEATRDNQKFTPEIQAVWEKAALMTVRRIIISAAVDNLIFCPEYAKGDTPKGYCEEITLSSINACHQLLTDQGVQRRNPEWFSDTMLLMATPVCRLTQEYDHGNEDYDATDLRKKSDCSVYMAMMVQLTCEDTFVGSNAKDTKRLAKGAIQAMVDYLVLSFGIPELPPEDEDFLDSMPVIPVPPPRRRM